MRGRHRRARTAKAAALGAALLGVVAATALQATTAGPASAFKPYTHVKTGDDARLDALDGSVTIAGRSYPVRAEVVNALTKWPQHYNSGVIGPDGFPDLVMGQGVIHPEDTGKWLRHVLKRAWAAQTEPGWGVEEREQILAFAYGYLTHASGDMWMHTMINEFADGVFPGPVDIVLKDRERAIAMRHLVAEGYVGDATPGFDGNPDRRALPNGDISDDSTPAIAFDAPLRFITRTLVDQQQRTPDGAFVAATNGPAQTRGKVMDQFIELRGKLQAYLGDRPAGPLEAALNAYAETSRAFAELKRPYGCDFRGEDEDKDGVIDDGCGRADDPDTEADEADPAQVGPTSEASSGPCSFGAGQNATGAPGDIILDIGRCPAALLVLGITAIGDTAEALLAFMKSTLDNLTKAIADAYVRAWITDIDEGLQAWPQLGLAVTRALFDPQARRDLQNRHCGALGPEDDLRRVSCEDGIGQLDVLFDQADPFINTHLIGMLGFPSVVGSARQLLLDLADTIRPILQAIPNPLALAIDQVKKTALAIAKDILEQRLNLDVDAVGDYLSAPSSKMDDGEFVYSHEGEAEKSIALWNTTVDETDHDKLDRYLGLPADHHIEEHGRDTRLTDHVQFDPESFKAYRNTVVLNKILLLDPEQTDKLMLDLSGGKQYRLYRDDLDGLGNVMLTPAAPQSGGQWLKSIDGDHAWRKDGAPIFVGQPSGGEGDFPLWDSCVLRDRGFRTLFHDWENDGYYALSDPYDFADPGDFDEPHFAPRGLFPTDRVMNSVLEPHENFPDWGDPVDADRNDKAAPVSHVVIGHPQAVGDGFTYVTGGTDVSLSAVDGFWKTPDIDTRVRIKDPSGTVVRTVLGLHHEDPIPLSGLPDGRYSIVTESKDRCGREAPHATEVFVDNTPPKTDFVSPVPGATYDTDDLPKVDYEVTDPGSGVAAESATFDGAATTEGTTLDMFFLQPGLHSVVVTATDRLGNESVTTSQLRLRATSVSLRNNVDRALSLKLMDRSTANAAKAILDAAVSAHARSDHATEHQQLLAYVNLLAQKSGKGVDPATAARFTAYAKDLVLAGG
jgi:hypothetical protein